jgi:tetratricopeptide (TPR) repeat protein
MLGEIDGAVARRIVTLAAGNAFHLEELIRAVAEGHGDALPETVRAMAQARLESLPPEERLLLRAASILGESFWPAALAALTGAAPSALSRLEEEEVIQRRHESRFSGEPEYAFRHALLRDAAYSLLPDRDRVAGHRAAAEWLEGAGERDAAVLADHWERGGERARAVVAYTRASIKATASGDMEAAGAYAERGIACGAEEVALGRLKMLRSQVEMWRGHVGVSEEAALEAMKLLPRDHYHWHNAAGLAYVSGTYGLNGNHNWVAEAAADLPLSGNLRRLARVLLSLSLPSFASGQYPIAQKLLARAESISDGEDPFAPPWLLLVQSAERHFVHQDLVTAAELARRAAAAFDRLGDVPYTNWAMLFDGNYSLELGEHDRVAAICDEILGRTKASYGTVVIWGYNLKAGLLGDLGRADEARAAARSAIDHAEALVGNRMLAWSARIQMVQACFADGDLAGAEREARITLELSGGEVGRRSRSLALLGRALAKQGRVDEAVAAADQAAAGLVTHSPWDRYALVQLSILEARLAAGRDVGEEILSEHRRLSALAERLPDDAARDRFWRNVPEHRRIRELIQGKI